MTDVEDRYHPAPSDGTPFQAGNKKFSLTVLTAVLVASGIAVVVILVGSGGAELAPVEASSKEWARPAPSAFAAGPATPTDLAAIPIPQAVAAMAANAAAIRSEMAMANKEQGEGHDNDAREKDTASSEGQDSLSSEGLDSISSDVFGLDSFSSEAEEEGSFRLTKALEACTELYLIGRKIGDVGAEALARMLPACKRLRILRLNENQIGDAGVQALAKALPSCGSLRLLGLSRNEIGDAGAQALAQALPACKRLWFLGLNKNKIADAGAQALANALPACKKLEDAFLNENWIGTAGKQALERVLPHCKRLAGIYMRNQYQGFVTNKSAAHPDLLMPKPLDTPVPTQDVAVLASKDCFMKADVELLRNVAIHGPHDDATMADLIQETRALSLLVFDEDILANVTRKSGLKLSVLTTREQKTFCGFVVTAATDGLMHIIRLGIRPEFRRRGLGRIIMQEILEASKKRSDIYGLGCSALVSAVKFYQRLGFKTTSGEHDGQRWMKKLWKVQPRHYRR